MPTKWRISFLYSPYGAQLLFICKKTWEPRIYIDYHILNKQAYLDWFSIPHIDDLLDKLTYTTIFIDIDSINVYYQVPIADGHQHKTVIKLTLDYMGG